MWRLFRRNIRNNKNKKTVPKREQGALPHKPWSRCAAPACCCTIRREVHAVPVWNICFETDASANACIIKVVFVIVKLSVCPFVCNTLSCEKTDTNTVWSLLGPNRKPILHEWQNFQHPPHLSLHSPLKSESGRGVPLKFFDFTLPYLSCSTFSVHHIFSVSSAETSENNQNVTPSVHGCP